MGNARPGGGGCLTLQPFPVFPWQVEQNWATLQGGEMTIQTTQASEATQAVASLAEAAVAASQEMQQGATVTMALNRYPQRARPGTTDLLLPGFPSAWFALYAPERVFPQ